MSTKKPTLEIATVSDCGDIYVFRFHTDRANELFKILEEYEKREDLDFSEVESREIRKYTYQVLALLEEVGL